MNLCVNSWSVLASACMLTGLAATATAAEAAPGLPCADDCFLHMIQTSDQTVETMIGTRVSETETQFQLAFSVGP